MWILLLFMAYSFREILGKPNGAPLCVESPRHGSHQPQTSDPEVCAWETTNPDGSIKVTVTAKTPFKGALILTKNAGSWSPGPHLKTLECTGSGGSLAAPYQAVTHTDRSDKTSVYAVFNKADNGATDENFKVILVRSFDKFWTNIEVQKEPCSENTEPVQSEGTSSASGQVPYAAQDPVDDPEGLNPVDAPEGLNQVEAPGGNPAETPGSDPTETPGSDPAETPGSNPTEAPGSEPAETPGSNPAEAPGSDDPVDALGSDDPEGLNPVDAPEGLNQVEAPGGNPGETPGSDPTETPGSDPTEGPGSEPAETPGSNPTEIPGSEPAETPSSNPTEAPGSDPTKSPGSYDSSTSGNEDTYSYKRSVESNNCQINGQCRGGQICTKNGKCEKVVCSKNKQICSTEAFYKKSSRCRRLSATFSVCIPRRCLAQTDCEPQGSYSKSSNYGCFKDRQCKPTYGECDDFCDCVEKYNMIEGEAYCYKKQCYCRTMSVASCFREGPPQTIKPVKTIKGGTSTAVCPVDPPFHRSKQGEPCRVHSACHPFNPRGSVCIVKPGQPEGVCKKRRDVPCSCQKDCDDASTQYMKCRKGFCRRAGCYADKDCSPGYACYKDNQCRKVLGDCVYDCDCSPCPGIQCFKEKCFCMNDQDICESANGFISMLQGRSAVKGKKTLCIPKTCPEGWTSTQSGCYNLIKDGTFNLEEAVAKCSEKKGYVAEMSSLLEFEEVFKNGMVSETSKFWLGAKKTYGQQMTWMTHPERPIFWKSDYHKESEGDCLHANGVSWENTACDVKMQVLCEIDDLNHQQAEQHSATKKKKKKMRKMKKM